MTFKTLSAMFFMALTITPMLIHAQQTPAAQPAATPQAQIQGTVPQINITDADLKQFAVIQAKINASHDAFMKKYQSMNETEKAQALAQLNNTLAEVVKSSGMTVEKMGAMSQAIRNNPELQRRLMGVMK